MSCNIIHEKCEKSAADDKSLPRNAYLVTYVAEEKVTYDVVMADSKVDVFDEYWDCLLYTSPSPRDLSTSRMPSSA